jgi:hypothetical protein
MLTVRQKKKRSGTVSENTPMRAFQVQLRFGPE